MRRAGMPNASSARLMACRVDKSVRCFDDPSPPESLLPPSPASKSLAPLRLRPTHEFLCMARSGPARMFSAQRWDHHWRITLAARRNPSQTVHQPLEDTLLLVVIAVA